MNRLTKKIFSFSLIFMFLFSTIGNITYAKEKGNERLKNEFNLKAKYNGRKLDKLKNTIKQRDKYKVIIKSDKTLEELETIYKEQDPKVKIKQIGENIFQIKISKNSILSLNFTNLENGNLPENLLQEKVVEPEVFELNDASPQLEQTSALAPLLTSEENGSGNTTLENYLLGEQTDNLWYLDKVGASTFQEELSTKDKIKVGILDTGIDSTQSDLISNYNTNLSYDFINENTTQTDENGHGTQIAGIVGASVNGAGTYGVNSNSDLVSLKVLDQDGFGTSYDVLEAINYAKENNIKILNLSFGGAGNPATSPVCEAITEAKNAGVFTVVSAGNGNQDISNIVPAGCSDAIVVGSYDKEGNKTSFSNYGNGVIYAPGTDIYTTNLNNSYITKSGTSYSAPIVAGLISKELAENTNLNYDEVLSNVKGNYNLKTNFTNNTTQNNSNTGVTTGSGNVVGTGTTSTGVTEISQVDLSNTKYYSGYFMHDGKTYGNSLYDDTYSFTDEELKGVQVFSYDEYKKLQESNKKDFRAMSITDGLVGKWDLNGNANDSSGNNNHGIPYNVTWVDSGRGDGKLVGSFNGYSSYITASKELQGLSAGTMSFWISAKNLSKIEELIGEWDSTQDTSIFAFDYISTFPTGKKLRLGCSGTDLTGRVNLYNENDFLNGNWNFIVVEFIGGNTLNVYLNGILQNPTSTTGNIPNLLYNSSTGFFGMGNGLTSGRFLTGKIGQVKIYNRALSETEIQQLYLQGILDNNTTTNTILSVVNQVLSTLDKKYNLKDNSTLVWLVNKLIKEENKTTSKADTNSKGDPVNLATGEFDYENTFLSIPGKGQNYEFKLTHKNQNYYNGPVGVNWDTNYNKYLSEESNGNVLYYNGKLGVFRFIKNTDGTFEYNLGLKATLTNSGGQYTLNYDTKDKEYFNTDKKLSKLQDKYSNELNFTYSGGLLSQVTDTLGRNINYTYDNSRLTEITDFNSNKVDITYYTGATSSGNLYDIKEVTINNGTGATKTIKYEYDTNRNLTKLIDSKGQTYVENTYDTNARVLTQNYGTGTISYNYTLNGTNIVSNQVTDKVGNITDYYYDANGNNTSTTYHTSSGNITYNYTYDTNGYLTTETKPLGNGTKYTYDTRGNILEKRQKTNMQDADDDTNDIITSYTYNDENKPTTITNPNGTIVTNTYDTNGNLTEKTTSNLKTSTGATYSVTENFTYNSYGELTSKTDGNGNQTNFSYSGGLLIQTTSGSGTNSRITNYTYNDYGILTSITDPRGNTTNYELTAFNQTGTGITSEGIVKSYIYDENNNITKETKYFTGGIKETKNTYDVLDQLTKVEEDYDNGKTRITNIKYDNNGNITEKQTGSGAKVKYTYNNFAKVVEERVIVNSSDSSKDIVTSYIYDSNGNVISKTDPKGNITTYTYDLFDRLIKETKSDGSYTNINYYKDGSIAQTQTYSSNDTKLTKKVYIYNGVGKVLKEISYKDPINNTGAIQTIYDYDNKGNVTSKTDPKGNTTIYTYDEFNNLIETTDVKENKVINTYDKNNNVVEKKIIQSNGKTTTTSYTYDKDNRRIRNYELENINGSGSITGDTHYEYNNLNQVVKITDGNGNITNYTYNYDGKLKSETKTNSGNTITTSYTYDERGNMTSVTDSNGNVTTYTYNNLNQLTKQTYKDGKEIVYTYDKAGNLTSKTDPNGNITTNTYDNLNRLTSKTIQTGTGVLGVTSETYTYDQAGRLIEANDSNNHGLNFTYDNLNRLTSETSPHPNPLPGGEGTISVSYTYDDNNNLTSITNSENKVTAYTYDELDRVTNIGFSGSLIASYTYTGILNDSLNYGNGINVLKTYDDLNRLNSLNNGVKSYNYTYDDVSNILSDSYKNFTYDDIYRLTQVNESLSGSLLESYNFDDVGNRTIDTNNSYVSNDLNQYTSLSGAVNKSLIYDNNGNLTSDGNKNFVYDYKNRLVKVTNLSGTGIIAEFSYDVLGRRYEKKTISEFTKYVYSNENVLSEYKTSNGVTLKKEYINGLGTDDLIAVEQEENSLTIAEREELSFCQTNVLTNTGGFVKYGWNAIVDRCESLSQSGSNIVSNRYYFSKDHLGSIVGITDNSGSLVASYNYDSYGNFSLSGADIGNTRLFTSREFDSEIGLYYYRARYYDSELGRFLSRDPIDIQDNINLYSYVGNNPVNFVDLMGLNSKSIIISKTLNLFNSSGNRMETHNNFAHGPVDVFATPLVGATFMTRGTFFDDANDLSVTRNSQYLFETGGPSNIKTRNDFIIYSNNSQDCLSNSNVGCFFTDSNIDSELNPIYLADLGNILAGYNAQKIGLSYNYIENTFWNLSEETAIKNYGKGTTEYYDYLNDEKIDQIAYKAGYELAMNTKTGNLTEQQFIETLSNVMAQTNKQRYK